MLQVISLYLLRRVKGLRSVPPLQVLNALNNLTPTFSLYEGPENWEQLLVVCLLDALKNHLVVFVC